MFFAWILLIIVAVILLRYFYLIIKRLFLVLKIKKRIKECHGNLQYARHPLISIFKHDGKTDFVISTQKEIINVSVITTPYRRIRYHFNNNKLLELILERRAVHILSRRIIHPAVVINHSYTIRKYKIEFDESEKQNHTQRYVIVNPAPILITKSSGATFRILFDNDFLFNGIRICGSRYFLNSVI